MIRYDTPQNVLVVTKGHPFEREPFERMLAQMSEMAFTHVEHPAAPALFDPQRSAAFSAFLCYDMPGLNFHGDAASGPRGVDFVEPPGYLVQGMQALLADGKPFVFLHHALAGWPAWDGYHKILGARFRYTRDAGAGLPDSGYRHDVRHRINVVADHPITQGLGTGFEIQDELYLLQIDESDKLPLLRSEHVFDAAGFYSAHEAAVNGRMFYNEGWQHPPGSNLIAWAKRAGNSPIVYIQCGDGPSAYDNPAYRILVRNALHWVTSTAAREWVARAAP